MTILLNPRGRLFGRRAGTLAHADFFAALPLEMLRSLRLSVRQLANETLLFAQGMGVVTTSHRCRGGQSALMVRCIEDAIALSARYLFTETGEPIGSEPNPSFNNMTRCGFVKVASRLNLAGPAVTIQSANR
jgi:hypothetical protein